MTKIRLYDIANSTIPGIHKEPLMIYTSMSAVSGYKWPCWYELKRSIKPQKSP